MEDNLYPPPPSLTGASKGYGLSGKIMLCAIVILFAVVVIMVCLHIYARWYILRSRRRHILRARRRTHLVFYVEPNDPSNIIPLPTRGLDASILKSLPTFTYRHKGDIDDVADKEAKSMECAVCLSEFEGGERGRALPKCKHSFHVECIDMWFHSHSTCPICRAPVDSNDLMMMEVAVESSPGSPGQGLEPIVPGTSSLEGRRKGLDMVGGVSIEVPKRSQSFSFSDTSSPSGCKSPTSRILSLKRILNREKKSTLNSPSSAAGPSCCVVNDIDIELGRGEEVSQSTSTSTTPR